MCVGLSRVLLGFENERKPGLCKVCWPTLLAHAICLEVRVHLCVVRACVRAVGINAGEFQELFFCNDFMRHLQQELLPSVPSHQPTSFS